MNIGSISTEARGDSDDVQTNITAPSTGNITADRGNSVNILA